VTSWSVPGMSWTAVAPVPMTAPAAIERILIVPGGVWMTFAREVGHAGIRAPSAGTRKPVAVDQISRRDLFTVCHADPPDGCASLVPAGTLATVLNRNVPAGTSNLSATSAAYRLISGPGVNRPRPVRVRSKNRSKVVAGRRGQAGIALTCQVPPRSSSRRDHEVVVTQTLELDGGA